MEFEPKTVTCKVQWTVPFEFCENCRMMHDVIEISSFGCTPITGGSEDRTFLEVRSCKYKDICKNFYSLMKTYEKIKRR